MLVQQIIFLFWENTDEISVFEKKKGRNDRMIKTSIGNEVSEPGKPEGVEQGKESIAAGDIVYIPVTLTGANGVVECN
jgi:hypothetical protein